MKFNNNNNKKGYSIIISIMVIWFLIVLTSWTFNLVLWELNDTKGRFDYIKAFSAAEWALELSLLKIKEEWYWYYDKINNDVNQQSIMLSSNPLDSSLYSKGKDILISYDMDSKVDSYSGSILPLNYDIIPLFYLDDAWEHKVNELDLSVLFFQDKLAWNIVSSNSWLSWIWWINSTTLWKYKVLSWWSFSFSEMLVDNFLRDVINNNNYLILFNSDSSNTIDYNLSTLVSWEYFTKPRAEIISSAVIWKYKQNLRTNLDNTKYLNILKYSIYSN